MFSGNIFLEITKPTNSKKVRFRGRGSSSASTISSNVSPGQNNELDEVNAQKIFSETNILILLSIELNNLTCQDFKLKPRLSACYCIDGKLTS